MSKKNVIYVLVDALSYDNIGKRKFRETPTPFLDGLKEKSLSCEKLYTQGPYTEAAFISGFCGENTLDNGGYMMGLSRCKTSYPSEFKKNGYHTLATFSPYVYASSYVKDVDDFYYSRVYSIQPLILYRFEHFLEKHRRNEMTCEEYELCSELLEDALNTWKDQLSALINNSSSIALIKDLINNNEKVSVLLETIEIEYFDFTDNKIKYIKNMFNNWDKHILLNIENISIKRKKSDETKKYILSKYENDLLQVQKLQNQMNKRNNGIDWKYLLNLTLNDEEGLRAARRTFRTYKNRFEDKEIVENIVNSIEEEKVTISAFRQLSLFEEKITELDLKDENYFCFIHLEDFHLPSMFYSYDINNKTILDEEMKYVIDYAKGVPENYKGNLLADMSVRYLDKKLSDFFHSLKTKLKNDFVFIVTADHGYPSNYNPPRPIIYNSFYQENYHIPLIMYDPRKEEKKNITGLYSSLDIMPKVITTCGMTKLDNLSEYDLEDLKDRDFIIIEYPGPGCPEINTKKIYYSIYNGRYKIGFKEYLDNKISFDSINGIFNLQEDPYEFRNLKRKMLKRSNSEILGLIELVNQRHTEIRNNFAGNKFYQKLIKKENRQE